MNAKRLLTAAATAALAVGISGAAWGQTPATAKTEAQAQAATGKSSTDAPANTAVQGTAAAVREGAAPATGAPSAAPAAAAGFTRVSPAGDIVQTLQASGQFKTLIKGLDATNLTPVLKQQPHLTVFAPTDAAFAAYGDVDKLMADLPTLQKLLLHHVINAEVDSAKFKGAHGGVASGAGDKIVLDGTADTLKADQANILQADVRASNGYINVVDQVLKAGSVPEQLPEAAEPSAEPQPATAEPAPAAKKTSKGTKRGGKS